MYFTSCKNKKGKKPVFENIGEKDIRSENEIINA